MSPPKRVETCSTTNHGTTEIDKEAYEIRDSELVQFVEKNQGHNRREIRFKWKPVHNLQSMPENPFLVRAMKRGIRKFQFAGHWAIEVGEYTWELWQDQETHQIGLGEHNKGPVKWTNLRVIRKSNGQVVKTEDTLKNIKSKRCGWTAETDTEIRDQAMRIIDMLGKRHTGLGRIDRLVQWQFKAQMKIVTLLLGKKRRELIEGMLGKQAEVRSGFIRALRGGDRSDEQYEYDVFFRNCHTFAERLALKISASQARTRLFFLLRSNAKTLLYNQMTQNSMPPSLQASMNQQQIMLDQQQLLNQQSIFLNQ